MLCLGLSRWPSDTASNGECTDMAVKMSPQVVTKLRIWATNQQFLTERN